MQRGCRATRPRLGLGSLSAPPSDGWRAIGRQEAWSHPRLAVTSPRPFGASMRRGWWQDVRRKDFTISQLVEELQSMRGLKVDRRSVWEFLHAEGLSHKKTAAAQEQDRKDVKRRREQWRKHQGRIDPKRLVFIDETWTKTNMAPLRGWGPRGSRVKGKAPFGRWKTMASAGRHRCAMPLRWSHQWRGLPGLGAPGPRSDA